jgi:hypothetical protein
VRRSLSLGLGVFLTVAGVIWTLQGLDLFGQSGGMNGQRVWAVIGPIPALAGLALIASSYRAGRPPRSRE